MSFRPGPRRRSRPRLRSHPAGGRCSHPRPRGRPGPGPWCRAWTWCRCSAVDIIFDPVFFARNQTPLLQCQIAWSPSRRSTFRANRRTFGRFAVPKLGPTSGAAAAARPGGGADAGDKENGGRVRKISEGTVVSSVVSYRFHLSGVPPVDNLGALERARERVLGLLGS